MPLLALCPRRPMRNDSKKTHPDLLPYKHLSPSAKELDLEMSEGILRHLLHLGFKLTAPDEELLQRLASTQVPSNAKSEGKRRPAVHLLKRHSSAAFAASLDASAAKDEAVLRQTKSFVSMIPQQASGPVPRMKTWRPMAESKAQEIADGWNPKPISTDSISLPAVLENRVSELAKQSHAVSPFLPSPYCLVPTAVIRLMNYLYRHGQKRGWPLAGDTGGSGMISKKHIIA